MNQIRISDTTLCKKHSTFSFKEKLEIARRLDKLRVDTIELPEVDNVKVDQLLIRTMLSFIENSSISVGATSPEAAANAAPAIKDNASAIIRIELPVSAVGMEYGFHRKSAAMLKYIASCVEAAKQYTENVEFCALDATRTDEEYLASVVDAAIEAGAKYITLCDDSSSMLPEDLAAFVKKFTDGKDGVTFAVRCNDKNSLAVASGIAAARVGVQRIKTCIGSEDAASLDAFASLIENLGANYKITCGVNYTRLHRITGQIQTLTDSKTASGKITASLDYSDDQILLDIKDDRNAVVEAAIRLGYDLSEDDQAKVYEEFVRVAEKKNVGTKEFEAIIASVAMQVPETYSLANFVINSGNIFEASAQITLNKDGKTLRGISTGDGPIDAAFLAIEQIIGHKYELDDFQIQAITEGKGAVGSALVKLRADGKLYPGNGISTDIIEASIRAYINAVNKISYEMG